MAQNSHQRKASDAVAQWLAHNELNQTWLSMTADVDPGTVGDFLKGERWPKIGTQGKIEKALGWPAGVIRQIGHGADVQPPMERSAGVSPEGSVDTIGDTDDTLLYRRPDGLSDKEWEKVKQESREFIEWQINRASRER